MSLNTEKIKGLKERSRQLRLELFDLSREYGGYHFGGSLSCIEILVDLYQKILTPKDRFILSKGHAAFSLYPLLRELGHTPTISGHPDIDIKNGIYATTGSLGMGFPTGAGIALAKKLKGEKGRVYVLMGEAECQEGTTWETLLIARQQGLDNLTGIVDYNKFQGSGAVEDILSLGNLEKKFKAFDSNVYTIDGHSHHDLLNTLPNFEIDKCSMIIANTIKGKGAKIMEQNPSLWHSKFPSLEELKQIYLDLGGEYKEIDVKIK